MWHLIFLFITFWVIWNVVYPFIIKFDIKINILKLKGVFKIKIFNKFNFEFKFRIKHGYIYLYFKNKEIKEKLTDKNFNVVFVLNLTKQLYFRHQLLNLSINSNFGFVLNSCATATCCGLIDVATKGIVSKIKNNKKTAHIFVEINPKYNEDIFNYRLYYEMKIAVIDIMYSLAFTMIRTIQFKLKKSLA